MTNDADTISLKGEIMKKLGLLRLVVAVCLLNSVSVCLAADSVVVKNEGKEMQTAQEITALQRKMKKLVSVDFYETPIDEVLRMMAMQSDVDIIKSPEVIGDVTASLTDVPLEEALRSILSAHGYAYITTDNVVMVLPQSQMAVEKEKMVNRVYRITYADVAGVYKALDEFISKEGDIAVNPGTSNIIVTDRESKVAAIDAFIEEVDRITPQILIEARIYDITGKHRLDLGFDWNAGTAPGITNPSINSAFNSSIDKASPVDGFIEYAVLNSNIDLSIELIAEQQELNAKLLANPQILAIDNELALIEIVTEIPYQELTETSEGGRIGSTEFREVGVKLEVVPHVTREGMVRLHIRPEFSIATGEVQVGGVEVDNEQPVVDTRRADTITLIKTGQTVVIGGLKKREMTQQIDKIPLLGDLPMVGSLFRFEGEEEVNSELLVFITPKIVVDPALSEYEKCRFKETEICMPDQTPLIKDRVEMEKCKDCRQPKEKCKCCERRW